MTASPRAIELSLAAAQAAADKQARDIVVLVRDEGAGLDDARRAEVREVLTQLASRFSYCDACSADMASMLVRKRYSDLIVN